MSIDWQAVTGASSLATQKPAWLPACRQAGRDITAKRTANAVSTAAKPHFCSQALLVRLAKKRLSPPAKHAQQHVKHTRDQRQHGAHRLYKNCAGYITDAANQ